MSLSSDNCTASAVRQSGPRWTTAISRSQIQRCTISTLLFVISLILIGSTAADYGIVWDEPAYFHASDLHIRWIEQLIGNPGQNRHLLLSDKSIAAAWHWNPYNVPHPPFSRIVSGFTKLALDPVLDKFTAYRMGPALFFAALVTVMYLWLDEIFGKATGIFSALAVTLIPNVFGFAHIAVTDLPLASLWFITAYAFWKGIAKWQWSVVLGFVWGLALATKFPAALIIFPLMLWAQTCRRNHYSNNIFAMLFIAPVVMIAIQPYLWHQTGLRLVEFLYEGISRGYRPDTNFGVAYFGSVVPSSALPWYYSFLMIGITTPEPFIALALIGILSIVWRSEERSAGLLFFINAVFILSLGMMPGAVLHDGVRQLLSALPFIAALAAVGFHLLLRIVVEQGPKRLAKVQIIHAEAKIAVILVLLFCVNPFFDVYLSHPFELSFYNRTIGGIRGAYHKGLETTYFMEAFTPNFLQTLNQNLPPNALITASWANFMLTFYQQEQRLRKDIRITSGPSFNYYVLLNRRSALGPRERRLMDAPLIPFIRVDLEGVPLVSAFQFQNRAN